MFINVKAFLAAKSDNAQSSNDMKVIVVLYFNLILNTQSSNDMKVIVVLYFNLILNTQSSNDMKVIVVLYLNLILNAQSHPWQICILNHDI